MKGTFKRSFFFFIIVLNLAVVALYSQISTNTDFQQPASKQLSELLSGKSANVDEIILSLPETDLPAALGVAEQLSFKALHNDIPMSPETVAKVRQTIESRLQKAKSVSLQSSEQCPVSVPARRLNVAGTEITVPSYFVTDQPIIISQTPTGEAGTFFPTISVTVAAPPGTKLHSVFLLNGKPFPLKQESSTSLIYRPSPSAENALSIGTHTAQITVTDARGRTASATWSFTVGIKPTAQPAIDPSWPVVGSFSIPLSHLIGNSAVSGNVQIIVYQTPEGKTIQKLVVTGGKGAGELTTQDPFWLGAIFNRRSDDPFAITMTPQTSLAFPGNSLVFTYSYSGIGTVAKEEWVIQEGSSVRKSRDAGVSWTMGKVPVRAIIYLTITVADANGDPSEAYANEGKGINPVLPSGLFGPWRFMSISEMATGSVRFSVQPGILIGDHSHLLIREDPLVLGNHLVFIEDAHVEQVGGNAHPTFEDSAATETNLLFSQPGWAEFRHVMRLRLVCGDETYKTTFEPDSYPLIGHFQASATITFSKLPPGIIAGTQRKANVSEVALTMNKESKTFSASTLADPWVLARSTTKPNSTPLAVSGLHIVIPENNIALPFDDFSVVLDPQFNEEHPSEFFFTPRIRPVTAGIDSDIRSISTRKIWTVPLYSEEALLETAFEPGEELTILENQNIDCTTVVKPVPGKGTGELKAGAGEIDLLEGYKVKKLEMLVWGQAHESEMPSKELKKPKQKNDVHWSYSFKPDKGTGTYLIGNGCYAMAYEPETDSEGIVSGGGQRTVTVIPGLKILSPKANFAYPQDTDIIVKTTFDNSLAEWNKIKWFIGSSEVHPTPAAPGWSLKLPPGKHTLKAMYSPPNTPPVIEPVTFQVVPISLKLTPERKITALPGSSTVPLKLTLSVNEVEIAKPGEEFNWLSTDFKAIASVSWSVFTAPDDIAEFNLTKPYEPKIIFSDKPTAVTALATVTLHISSPAHPETVFDLTLPLARADVWGVTAPIWKSFPPFPDKGIASAQRTCEFQTGNFSFNDKTYSWSVNDGIQPTLTLAPALFGIDPVPANTILFTWQGPNGQTGKGPKFQPILSASGNLIRMASLLDFSIPDAATFPEISHMVSADALIAVVTPHVDPSSFTLFVGNSQRLTFGVTPRLSVATRELLIQNGNYSLAIEQVNWLHNGSIIGTTNPFDFSASTREPVAIDAEAMVILTETEAEPPGTPTTRRENSRFNALPTSHKLSARTTGHLSHIIAYPGNGYAFPASSTVLLKANPGLPEPEKVEWFVDGATVGQGSEIRLASLAAGDHQIEARLSNRIAPSERCSIKVFPWEFSMTPARHVIAWPETKISTPVRLTAEISDRQIASGVEVLIGKAKVAVASLDILKKAEPSGCGSLSDFSMGIATCTFTAPGAFAAQASCTFTVIQPDGVQEAGSFPVIDVLLGAVQAKADYSFAFEPKHALPKMTREFTIGSITLSLKNGATSIVSNTMPAELSPPLELVKPLFFGQSSILSASLSHDIAFGEVRYQSAGLKTEVYFPSQRPVKVSWTPALTTDSGDGLITLPATTRVIIPGKFEAWVRTETRITPQVANPSEPVEVAFLCGPRDAFPFPGNSFPILNNELTVSRTHPSWALLTDSPGDNDVALPFNTDTFQYFRSTPGTYTLACRTVFTVTPCEIEAPCKASIEQQGMFVVTGSSTVALEVDPTVADHLDGLAHVKSETLWDPYHDQNGYWVWRISDDKIETKPLAVGIASMVKLLPKSIQRQEAEQVPYSWTNTAGTVVKEGLIPWSNKELLIPTPPTVGQYTLRIKPVGLKSFDLPTVYAVQKIDAASNFKKTYFDECVEDSVNALAGCSITTSPKEMVDKFFDWWWLKAKKYTYYASDAVSTAGVISKRGGMCQGLGNLFYKALECQGIPAEDSKTVPRLKRGWFALTVKNPLKNNSSSISPEFRLPKKFGRLNTLPYQPTNPEYWGGLVVTDPGLGRTTPKTNLPIAVTKNVYAGEPIALQKSTTIYPIPPHSNAEGDYIPYPAALEFKTNFPAYLFNIGPDPETGQVMTDGHALVWWEDKNDLLLYDPSFGKGIYKGIQVEPELFPGLDLKVQEVIKYNQSPSFQMFWENYLAKSVFCWRSYTHCRDTMRIPKGILPDEKTRIGVGPFMYTSDFSMHVVDARPSEVNYLRLAFQRYTSSEETHDEQK